MADRKVNKDVGNAPVRFLSFKRSKRIAFGTVIGVLTILLFVFYTRLHFENYPLHMALKMVSRFGELRPDHFHMGLDISTNGKENVPVYAICDGYISEVKVEESNTGKCLFVKQTDGIISVYGHLNLFSKELEQYVHQKQYKEHRWEQDIHFTIPRFPVKKGELIGYSGNTGHSNAPHLHFELRDARTGLSFNPQKDGILTTEYSSPDLKAVYWYDRSISIYKDNAHLIRLNEGATRSKPLLVSSSIIGLGITVEDNITEKYKSTGVTKASIEEDGKIIYQLSLDSLSETDSRSINARIDYRFWYTTGNYIQYLFNLPGNALKSSNSGYINLSDRNPHKITIRYGDNLKSNSSMSFYIKYEPKLKESVKTNDSIKLMPDTSEKIEKEDIRLYFPPSSLYDTLFIHLRKIQYEEKRSISPIYNFGDGSIPMRDSFTLFIKSTSGLTNSLRNKTVMELTNKKSKLFVKGKWNGNWMEGKFSEMGTIRLIIDSTPPRIVPVEWMNNQSLSGIEFLQFKCEDDTGLKSVQAKLDGHWILLSKKGNLYTYQFDEYCHKGKNKLVIRSIDLAGNVTIDTFNFFK
jgi:Membrane proteins related to metalloendopeptidases